MRKASNVLFIIGSISIIMGLFAFLIMDVSSFAIASPSYKSTLIDQISSGTLITHFEGSSEEQASQVQQTFLIMAIIFLLIIIITTVKLVFAFLAKKNNEKYQYITSIVLGAVTLDIFILLAAIFGLKANKEEECLEINASI